MEDWKLREIAEACVRNCDDTEAIMDWAAEYLITLYKEDPATLKGDIERFGQRYLWDCSSVVRARGKGEKI